MIARISSLTSCSCCLIGELLVLPLGEARELLCTAPADTGYIINWIVNGTLIRPEETNFRSEDIISANMSRGMNLKFIATQQVNNTNVHCLITDIQRLQISKSSQFFNTNPRYEVVMHNNVCFIS